MQPFDPNVIPHATRLIRQIGMSLATVDAFHLASAQACGCSAIATSDRLLARAAKLCELKVHDFSI